MLSSQITFNSDLVDDLARQKVVLFLGAGVSASARTRSGSHIKGWDQFLTDLSDKTEDETKKQISTLLGRGDYLLACEILKGALAERWDQEIKQEFGQIADPSKLHEAIVSLDQRIVITTNFDKLLEASWETKIGQSSHFPTVSTKIDANIFSLLKDHSGQHLIKLHGTIDDPDTIIFSRSEYIRMAFGSATYATFLETMLLTHTFLFIGFSMEDPAVSSLMEMYALRYPRARPHYIFSDKSIASNLFDINRRLRKLIAIGYDTGDSHAELPELIAKLSGEMKKRRRELFASMLV
mgnify:CR=1 FL=1